METESGGSVSVAGPLRNNHVIPRHSISKETSKMVREEPKQENGSAINLPFFPSANVIFEDHFYESLHQQAIPGPSFASFPITEEMMFPLIDKTQFPAELPNCSESKMDESWKRDVDMQSETTNSQRKVMQLYDIQSQQIRLNNYIGKLKKMKINEEKLRGHLPEYSDMQPSTSSDVPTHVVKPYISESCCLMDDVDGVWVRCRNRPSRPLTKMLQNIVIHKKLPLAVDEEDPSLCICVVHRRLIRYGRGQCDEDERIRMESVPESLSELMHSDKYSHEMNGQSLDTSSFLEDSDSDSVRDQRKLKGRRRKNGDKTAGRLRDLDSDQDPEQPSSKKSLPQCDHCGHWQHAPCNSTTKSFKKPDSMKTIKGKSGRSKRKRFRKEKVPLPVESENERNEDDDEDEKSALSVLSAASLRNYRKHFNIPTKGNATKHTMLDGVVEHFERMPPDAGEAIAFFMHTVKNKSEKKE